METHYTHTIWGTKFHDISIGSSLDPWHYMSVLAHHRWLEGVAPAYSRWKHMAPTCVVPRCHHIWVPPWCPSYLVLHLFIIMLYHFLSFTYYYPYSHYYVIPIVISWHLSVVTHHWGVSLITLLYYILYLLCSSTMLFSSRYYYSIQCCYPPLRLLHYSLLASCSGYPATARGYGPWRYIWHVFDFQ